MPHSYKRNPSHLSIFFPYRNPVAISSTDKNHAFYLIFLCEGYFHGFDPYFWPRLRTGYFISLSKKNNISQQLRRLLYLCFCRLIFEHRRWFFLFSLFRTWHIHIYLLRIATTLSMLCQGETYEGQQTDRPLGQNAANAKSDLPYDFPYIFSRSLYSPSWQSGSKFLDDRADSS